MRLQRAFKRIFSWKMSFRYSRERALSSLLLHHGQGQARAGPHLGPARRGVLPRWIHILGSESSWAVKFQEIGKRSSGFLEVSRKKTCSKQQLSWSSNHKITTIQKISGPMSLLSSGVDAVESGPSKGGCSGVRVEGVISN